MRLKLLHLAALVALLVNAAWADTFTVTRTNISGPGSLPVIINTANATPGQHIIEFSVTGTIGLVSPLPLITNSLTINGRSNITVSGSSVTPVFSFAAGTTNSLSGLTIRDAYRSVGNGAAISNAGTLLLSGCVLSNNALVAQSLLQGGSIYSAGPLSIIGSQFHSNTAPVGGAISASNGLSIVGSSFTSNLTFQSEGGALYCSGAVTVADTIFAGNQALQDGGAIKSLGPLQITGSTLVSNVASAGNGGAISVQGSLALSNCVVTANIGRNGGAVECLGPLNGVMLTVSSNFATRGFGGGLFTSGQVSLSRVTLSANTAQGEAGRDGSGGGGGGAGLGGAWFHTNGVAALTNCTISGNRAAGGAGGSGAGTSVGGNGGGNNPGAGGSLGQGLVGGAGGFGGGGGGGGDGGTTFPTQGSGGPGGFGGGNGGSGFNFQRGSGGSSFGGGVFVANARMTVVNCTISSNAVNGGPIGPGGGAAPPAVEGTGVGGGLYAYSSTGSQPVVFLNTLNAGNSATSSSPDLFGTNFNSAGFNLIGNNQGASGLSINDYQNEPPNIGPLQDNGGGTLTHALLANSLAVGAGTSVGAPTTDQRGFIRLPGQLDIGAFQFSTAAAVNITSQPMGQSIAPGGSVTLSVAATGSGLSYQWQFNGANLPGATSPTLNLANIAATNAGAYRVVVSSSAGGSTASQSANLLFFGDLKFYGGATLGGPVGQQFRVDYADVVNVGTTNWLVLTNVALPFSPYLMIDPSSPGQTKRFYRAVPLP